MTKMRGTPLWSGQRRIGPTLDTFSTTVFTGEIVVVAIKTIRAFAQLAVGWNCGLEKVKRGGPESWSRCVRALYEWGGLWVGGEYSE